MREASPDPIRDRIHQGRPPRALLYVRLRHAGRSRRRHRGPRRRVTGRVAGRVTSSSVAPGLLVGAVDGPGLPFVDALQLRHQPPRRRVTSPWRRWLPYSAPSGRCIHAQSIARFSSVMRRPCRKVEMSCGLSPAAAATSFAIIPGDRSSWRSNRASIFEGSGMGGRGRAGGGVSRPEGGVSTGAGVIEGGNTPGAVRFGTGTTPRGASTGGAPGLENVPPTGPAGEAPDAGLDGGSPASAGTPGWLPGRASAAPASRGWCAGSFSGTNS
jgi:hypothetical protein